MKIHHKIKTREALSKAVNAIYFDDGGDFLSALWGIVKDLGGEEATALLEEDEAAAYKKYNIDET